MAEIHIMSNIDHKEGSTCYIDYDERRSPLHEHQGSMDGACAVYSIIMSLKLVRYISNADVEVYGKLDKRTHKGRLLHELMEARGLVRQGTVFKELTQKIKLICKDDIYIEHIKFKTNAATITQLEEIITDNWIGSVVLGMDYKNGGGHAVLFVGIEYDSNGKVSKILCLDPGCEESFIAPWNCYIEVTNKRGKYPFVCYDNKGVTSDNCAISEIIYIEYKD